MNNYIDQGMISAILIPTEEKKEMLEFQMHQDLHILENNPSEEKSDLCFNDW